MSTFFHGWRRKLGCVTLVLAIMVSVVWGRSFVVTDELGFSTSADRWHIFASELGEFQWKYDQTLRWRAPIWHAYPISVNPVYTTIDHENSQCVVRYTESVSMGTGFKLHSFEIIAPYWIVVGPLTLLSALLILWPKKKTPKQRAGVVVNPTAQDPASVQNMLLECPQVTR